MLSKHRKGFFRDLFIGFFPSPADPIYKQMKDLNQKIAELTTARARLQSEVVHATAKAIDEPGLRRRLERAITRLESASPEDQRPVYANVLKFAELHPTRIKLGIYAPTKENHDARFHRAEPPDFI